MLQVFSKTKRARHGLAKVLLLIILLASLVFAWFVQRRKFATIVLNLNQTIRYKNDARIIELKTASDWKMIDNVSSFGKEFLAAWNIPMGAGEEPANLFFLRLPPSSSLPELQAYLVPRQLLGYAKILVEIQPVKSAKFLAYDCIGAAATRVGVRAIAIRVMNMPDTSSLVLAFTGPRRLGNTFELWLAQLSATIKYQPSKQTKLMKKHQLIEMEPVSFRFPAPTWASFDTENGTMRMQSETTDPDKFWTGRIQILPASEYRKFLINYLRVAKVSRLGKFGDFSVGYTEKDKGIIMENKRIIYSQIAYIAESQRGFGILITVNASLSAKKNAKKDIEKMLRSLRVVTGV